ncbi:MAG: LysM peptidoglycan-binding domain-containing protein [Candidatus Riflebacteria bacterium]|nr:LysM peptidoglycan-binding domain-containing protein [Candidatus Riflebacteria bacterium]
MKKTGLFIFIFIGLLLAAPTSYANDSSGLFNVSTEIEQPAVNIPVSSEEVQVTVTSTSAPETEEAPAATAPVVESEPISYTIESDDNLWSLAEKYLGDGNRYPEIVEANKDKYPSLVSNPDLIHPGWNLEIPPKEEPKKEEPKKDEPKVESKDEKGAEDVVVERDSGTNVDKVVQVKPMTTVQKLKKLNNALDKINKDIKSDGYKITDLTEKTVRDLIDKGYMTEEEWMSMNPPEGWSYDVRFGKVTLVNKRNRPLTNLELLVMTVKDVININKDKKEAEKAKLEADKAKTTEVKKEEPKKEEVKELSDEELAKNDSESKQKSYDEAMGRTTKTATQTQTATQTATETEVKKAVEEVKVGADKLYADAITEIGVPDIRSVKQRDYSKAMSALTRLLTWKEENKYAYVLNGYSNIIDLEKTLKSSQETYVKKVDKDDTGWFGGSIKSAGNNVESNKKTLKKAWTSLEEAIKIAKAKADESAKKIEENKKLAESLAKQKEEIGYDTSKAKELQQIAKQIKDLESDNKDLQKDVDAYKDIVAVFKV